MPIISVNHLNKSFGDHIILEDVSFDIGGGERVGLIGRNGSGKTTLLRILTGDSYADKGDVHIEPAARVEVLEQIPRAGAGDTVEAVIRTAFDHLREMERRIAAMEAEMTTDHSAPLLKAYDRLRVEYDTAGGYEQDLNFARTVAGLGFGAQFLSREFNGLSGGEKTKVNLARIILSSPEVLLLDEPTNHLDMRSIEWIEEFLAGYKGTVILISHDRYFLDRVCTRIIELAGGKVTSFSGNYSEYMAWKEARAEQLERLYEREQAEIDRLETVSEKLLGWGIQTERLSRAALSMRKRIERLRANRTTRIVRDNRRIHAVINDGGRTGFDLLSVIDVAAGYDGEPVFEDVTLDVKQGERIALLGDNGAGKTTFFKLLTGEKKPMSGRIKFGANVKVGLMPQTVTFEHPERNLVDTLLYAHPVTARIARDRLAAYDFVGEEVFKLVADLSGGELSRLKLCLLSFEPINLFLLDEPTNHLDITAREWIENTLEEYEGAMIFISHDRYFISRFADRILTVADGHIDAFSGDFEAWRQARAQPAAPVKIYDKKPKTKEVSPAKAGRVRERAIAACERDIAALERELAGVKGDMDAASTDYEALEALTAREGTLRDEIDRLYSRLDELYEGV
ncbi:MAG TPA: ABC-F family ATP-binding cassette domain-containing protein [Terriglobales bacterium]|nr:ABC-F family ATP-binding cassette domain-containing protein [Terriglobales bacterium]